MSGEASMAPGPDGSAISVTVANGVPGSIHPWAVHEGQCGGTDGGVVGSSDAYKPMTVGADGRAMSAANIYFMTPRAGNYFVSIKTSAANITTTVACGNLTAPTT
jgi:hypothetical protein